MAANTPLGNNFWEGVLGVVNIIWNSIDFGKTTADTEIQLTQDLKDIIFQQDGTQRGDKVRTGIVYQVNCTFGEIDTELLDSLQPGITKSGAGNTAKIGRCLYQSMKDSEAKELQLIRVDSEGSSSSDPLHKCVFYLAAPEITGNIMYGADTQRNLAVSFHIFWNSTKSAFGYSGIESSVI
jgi:hypothetical protein